jgi:hypothetical protein
MTGETQKKENLTQELLEKHPAIQLINHPCRIVVIGRSQSGKTTIAADIALWLSSQVDDIYLISPTHAKQTTWKVLKETRSLTYAHENLERSLIYVNKKMIEDNHKRRSLIILDDVSFEKVLNEGNKGLLNGLSYNARWYNLSILTICHKVSNIGAGIRENIEHLIMFNTINNKELENVYDNFSFVKEKRLFMAVVYSLIEKKILSGEDPYAFIYVCFQKGITIHEKFNCKVLLN